MSNPYDIVLTQRNGANTNFVETALSGSNVLIRTDGTGNLVLSTTAPSASYAVTSSWAVDAGTAITADSASHVDLSVVNNALSGSGVVSSSAQTLVNLQGSSVVSSSAQTLVNLQGSDIVSSSAQFDGTDNVTFGQLTASAIYVDVLHVHTTTASNALVTGSFIVSGSIVGLSGVTASVLGNVNGTASWATNAVTAQTALDVDYADVSGITVDSQFAGTASYAVTASFAQNFNPLATASYAITAATASYVVTAHTASYVANAQTASYVAWANVDGEPYIVSESAQLVNGGGVAFDGSDNVTFGQVTASAADVSGDLAVGGDVAVTGDVTADGVLKVGSIGTEMHEITGSLSVSGSITLTGGAGANVFGDSLTDKHEFTGSVQVTGSLFINGVAVGETASYALTAGTASYISLATHNNAIVGTGIVSSSAQTLVNLQSSGIYSSSAQIAFITASADTASYVLYSDVEGITATSQFAGTASYALRAGTASYATNVDISGALSGSGIVSSSAQTIVNLQGSDIVSSSAQFDGTDNVTFGQLTASAIYVDVLHVHTTTASNALVTGSFIVSGSVIGLSGFTGSVLGNLNGTASWASNAVLAQTASYVALAQTASYVETAQTASNVDYSDVTGITATSTFAGTASYATTAEVALDVDYSDVSGITATSQFAGTASFALNADTASYAMFSVTASFAQNFNPLATASYALKAILADTASGVLVTTATAPISSSDAGITGEIRISDDYVYFRRGSTWKRVAIATFTP